MKKIVITSIFILMFLTMIGLMVACTPVVEEYTVQYEGENGLQSITVKVGEFFSIPYKPVKDGYEFLGWYDQNEGGEKICNSEGISLSSYNRTSNMMLYPQFTIKTYVISFVFEDGSIEEVTVSHNSNLSEVAPKGNVPGKAVSKWSTVNNDTELTSVFNGKITSAMTLYAAKYSYLYTVKHFVETNDGKAIKETEDFVVETIQSVTPNVKEFAGYTAPLKQTVTINAVGETVIEYVYTRNTYHLNLHLEGGSIMGATTIPFYVDTPISKDEISSPTKQGSIFAGWYTAPNGTGKWYYEVSLGTTENIDLYALWYDGGSGSIDNLGAFTVKDWASKSTNDETKESSLHPADMPWNSQSNSVATINIPNELKNMQSLGKLGIRVNVTGVAKAQYAGASASATLDSYGEEAVLNVKSKITINNVNYDLCEANAYGGGWGSLEYYPRWGDEVTVAGNLNKDIALSTSDSSISFGYNVNVDMKAFAKVSSQVERYCGRVDCYITSITYSFYVI